MQDKDNKRIWRVRGREGGEIEGIIVRKNYREGRKEGRGGKMESAKREAEPRWKGITKGVLKGGRKLS